MINKFKISFLVILGSLFMAKTSLAVCPVCTVAVGAGVGLSRWLGVDDLITGTWIGGLLVSMIWWTIDWLNKKNIRFSFLITFVKKHLIIISNKYLYRIIKKYAGIKCITTLKKSMR